MISPCNSVLLHVPKKDQDRKNGKSVRLFYKGPYIFFTQMAEHIQSPDTEWMPSECPAKDCILRGHLHWWHACPQGSQYVVGKIRNVHKEPIKLTYWRWPNRMIKYSRSSKEKEKNQSQWIRKNYGKGCF